MLLYHQNTILREDTSYIQLGIDRNITYLHDVISLFQKASTLFLIKKNYKRTKGIAKYRWDKYPSNFWILHMEVVCLLIQINYNSDRLIVKYDYYLRKVLVYMLSTNGSLNR